MSGWTEEKKHRDGAGGALRGLVWFWMKEWSLISFKFLLSNEMLDLCDKKKKKDQKD